MAHAGTLPASYDNYFNDLSAPTPDPPQAPQVPQYTPPPPSNNNSSAGSSNPAEQPKAKRLACALCRKRKLRCDQVRPKCGTCARLGHECKYDEVRRKSGPKRGYVKALEARLAQVETLLRTSEDIEAGPQRRSDLDDIDTLGMDDPLRSEEHNGGPASKLLRDAVWIGQNSQLNPAATDSGAGGDSTRPTNLRGIKVGSARSPGSNSLGRGATQSPGDPNDPNFPNSFEMIALGLEEPLPIQDLQDELHTAFFNNIGKLSPMINRARYFAAMDLAPNMRPPICLRYAIWTQAASAIDKYAHLVPIFYQRTRKYLEADEMRGFGQAMLTVAHCQTWILVGLHEFRNMYFPKAWMSCGRAVRLAQMMSLHRIDGTGLDVKQTLVPPRDETEREERRRTFWFAFWSDRCASIGTGWPMSIDEKDILTNLPGSDDDFQNCSPSPTFTLEHSLKNINSIFSAAAGCVIMASLFGRNLIHLHRPDSDDNEHDINGKFWQRHRALDRVILDISINLPEHLRLSMGFLDHNIVFLNLCLHTSVICLHQAAIYKAEKHHMAPAISGESKLRCIAAAAEIASIMRTVAHHQSGLINPFVAFCLYVAARVFVQFLRARPSDQQVLASLHFLYSMMGALARKNPIVESFMAQLELDMEVAGVPRPAIKESLASVSKRGVPEFVGQSSGNIPVGNQTGTPFHEIFPTENQKGFEPINNSRTMPLGTPKPRNASTDTSRIPGLANLDEPRPDRHFAFTMYNPNRAQGDFPSPPGDMSTGSTGHGSASGGDMRQSSSPSAYNTPDQTEHNSNTRIGQSQPDFPANNAYIQHEQSTGGASMAQNAPPMVQNQEQGQQFFPGPPFGSIDDMGGYSAADPFKTGLSPGPGFDFNLADQDPPISVPRVTTMGQDWDMGGGNLGPGGTGMTPRHDSSWSNVMEDMQSYDHAGNSGSAPASQYWMGSSGM